MKLIDAYQRFANEHIAFLKTRIYLLEAHEISAVPNGTDLAEAHADLVGRISPRFESPQDYVLARLFIALISSFELYLQDLMSCVIRLHPKKAGSTTFKLGEILDAAGKDELIQRAIEEMLNKMMYKKPLEYLDELVDVLSIDKSTLLPDWPVFVEAKARRDLGVHNDWICNSTYLKKLAEAGITTSLRAGDNALPVSEPYDGEVPRSLFSLAGKLFELVSRKHPELAR